MTDLSDLRPFEGQCTAHKKNGARCRKHSINGSNVCRSHGGAAPQVKRAAALRLLMAADSVAGELVRIALSKTASDATKVQAIFGILDRVGLNARQAVDVDVAVGLKQSAEDIYRDIVLASTVPVGSLDPDDWDDLTYGPYPGTIDPNVIDAEIVEDQPALERARESEMDDVERNAHRREAALRRQRPEQPSAPAPRRAPSIEDDPRDRQPVPSREEALTKGREQFLIQREGLAPKKRHQRRTP